MDINYHNQSRKLAGYYLYDDFEDIDIIDEDEEIEIDGECYQLITLPMQGILAVPEASRKHRVLIWASDEVLGEPEIKKLVSQQIAVLTLLWNEADGFELVRQALAHISTLDFIDQSHIYLGGSGQAVSDILSIADRESHLIRGVIMAPLGGAISMQSIAHRAWLILRQPFLKLCWSSISHWICSF